ncbi:MAG: CHAT domain-containing protein [Chloroflexaceae bacterium]
MPRQPRILPPPRQRCDTLRLIIERASHQEMDYYRANLQQSGVTFIVGGRMRRPEAFMVQAARIQALRRAFEQQVQTMHAWAAQGLASDTLGSADMQHLVELGREVGHVLPYSVRQGISAALQRARNRQRRLHMTLEVAADAQDILALPWELLWLPTTAAHTTGPGTFVLLDAQVSLVRQVRGVGRNRQPRLAPPLNLHVFAASPQGVPPIDLEPARQALQQILPPEVVRQRWYQDAGTLTWMQQHLETDQPQIVHLICHGHQQSTGRDMRNDLLLTWHDGLLHRVNAFTLATVCSLSPPIRLILLQACHAGAADLLDTLGGTADDSAEEMQRRVSEGIALTLIRYGVPVVVAMQGAVGQAAAGAFVQAFYATLNRGGRVEEAVAGGRIRMSTSGGVVDWSLPVIYQGSGLPAQTTWHERLADRFTAALFDPAISGSIRGLGVLLAVLLLATSSIRWLFGIPGTPPAPVPMLPPLVVWTILGVLCPLIIGATYRGARDRADLPHDVRRAVIVGQWMGAFISYALGGLMGLVVLAITWMLGLLTWSPGLFNLLGPIVLLWAAFTSYAGTRTQAESARAVSEVDPYLYDRFTAALVIGVMLALTLSPWLLYRLALTPWAFLLTPATSALILSLLLLMLILLWKE